MQVSECALLYNVNDLYNYMNLSSIIPRVIFQFALTREKFQMYLMIQHTLLHHYHQPPSKKTEPGEATQMFGNFYT